jgi:hypothetical protein
LGSKVSGGNTSEVIDEKTLLQVNASMVIGALFILTLTAFISGPESHSRFFIGYMTILIIGPFAISALITLNLEEDEYKTLQFAFAKGITISGFVVLAIYLILIVAYPHIQAVFFQLSKSLNIEYQPWFGEIEYDCAKSPETFNVTAAPWKCSEFTEGSLAERCVKIPELFNVPRSECSKFISPSS